MQHTESPPTLPEPPFPSVHLLSCSACQLSTTLPQSQGGRRPDVGFTLFRALCSSNCGSCLRASLSSPGMSVTTCVMMLRKSTPHLNSTGMLQIQHVQNPSHHLQSQVCFPLCTPQFSQGHCHPHGCPGRKPGLSWAHHQSSNQDHQVLSILTSQMHLESNRLCMMVKNSLPGSNPAPAMYNDVTGQVPSPQVLICAME